jgi:hypothetical protein
MGDAFHNKNLPPFTWQAVSGPYFAPMSRDIPDRPSAHNAQAVEIAQAVSGCGTINQTRIPSANSGFHLVHLEHKVQEDERMTHSQH